MNKLSVYIHVPFCVSKCGYCDFLSFSGKSADFGPYLEALIKEIGLAAPDFKDYKVDTVFIGGGTPTVLPAKDLAAVLSALFTGYHVTNDAEISVEANPETVDFHYLKGLREAGANRLSLGVQSFNDNILADIGRIHTAAQARMAYLAARQAGFDNINLDLMFSLPGQNLADWEKTVNAAIDLSPDHISCYSLTVEPDTALGRQGYDPDEDSDRAMFARAVDALTQSGYEHYEISNFAKIGRQCRHNIVYWTGYEYRGFGLGAHSLVHGVRSHNACGIEDYLADPGKAEDAEYLNYKDLVSEFMFLGLRMLCGVDGNVFYRKFGKQMFRVYEKEIRELTEQGLLKTDGDVIRLTRRGVDLANQVFVRFI